LWIYLEDRKGGARWKSWGSAREAQGGLESGRHAGISDKLGYRKAGISDKLGYRKAEKADSIGRNLYPAGYLPLDRD